MVISYGHGPQNNRTFLCNIGPNKLIYRGSPPLKPSPSSKLLYTHFIYLLLPYPCLEIGKRGSSFIFLPSEPSSELPTCELPSRHPSKQRPPPLSALPGQVAGPHSPTTRRLLEAQRWGCQVFPSGCQVSRPPNFLVHGGEEKIMQNYPGAFTLLLSPPVSLCHKWLFGPCGKGFLAFITTYTFHI